MWANLSAQGEFFRAFTIYQRRRENFFARAAVGRPVHYPSATGPHWCGGRRRGRRVREDSRRRAKSHISDLAPLVWRTSESPEGPAAAPVDNGARPQYPQTTATPRPDKFRMQFPHDTDRHTLKNRRISTIRLQYLKYTQGNCMRNCRDAVRTQYHAATRPAGVEGARGAGGPGRRARGRWRGLVVL